MGNENSGSREFWEGYRSAQIEMLMLGIEAFEAKYAPEFEENQSMHFRGACKALDREKKKLSAMIKGGF